MYYPTHYPHRHNCLPLKIAHVKIIILYNPQRLNKSAVVLALPFTMRLKSFLGTVGFHQKYIDRYAEKGKALTDLLKKGEPNQIKWDAESNESFQTLKTALTQKPVNIITPFFTGICLFKIIVLRHSSCGSLKVSTSAKNHHSIVNSLPD